MIQVFLSRPNWFQKHVGNQLELLEETLNSMGMESRTIGTNVEPLTTPFDEVVDLMKRCDCTIVLGLSQIRVREGSVKGKDIERGFGLPTEWNQIEAAISIMLGKPTLMMLHKGVANRGLFERGAANVFVHEFDTLGRKWLEDIKPKLMKLKEKVNA